jgi:hypothetical protein
MTRQLGNIIENLHQDIDKELGTVENIDPSVFATKANSEDTRSYEAAMHGTLPGEFRKC